MGYQVGQENSKSMKTKYKEETIEDVLKYPFMDIEDRGITKKTCERLGIRTAVSETDGITPIALYFPYHMEGKIVGFKKRDLTKPKEHDYHFTTIGYQGVKCDFFNSHNCNVSGGTKLWVCEGELDCAIVWQIIKNRFPKNNPNVVSISNGTAAALKNVSQKRNQQILKKFKENIFVFDPDSASPEEKKKGIKKGREALAEVYGLMPNILTVSLPDDRDPCDVFRESGEEQLYWIIMKPKPYTPEGFTTYEEIRDAALAPPVLGKPWPWPSFTKLTLGRRGGEGYYFGAGVKMGKSSLANKVIQHIYENEKNQFGDPQKVAVFKFEELPEETVKKVAGAFYKVDFTNPEKRIFITDEGNEVDIYGNPVPVSGPARAGWFKEEDLVRACDAVGPRILLYKNYGRANWAELKGAIRHAVLVEHVEDVFIDPISRLVQGMSASDANTELEGFADEISKMAKELNFTYYCFSHLKAPEKGAHEFGAEVLSNQFHGSRAMQRSTYYMIGLQGNKHHTLTQKQRNTRELVILDDRKYGRTGVVKLYYDPDTSDFVEPPPDFWLDDEIVTLAQFYEKYPEGVIEEKEKF